jgi:hypothetical protein
MWWYPNDGRLRRLPLTRYLCQGGQSGQRDQQPSEKLLQLCVIPHGDLLLSPRRIGRERVRGPRRITSRSRSVRIGFPGGDSGDVWREEQSNSARRRSSCQGNSWPNPVLPGASLVETSPLRVLTLDRKSSRFSVSVIALLQQLAFFATGFESDDNLHMAFQRSSRIALRALVLCGVISISAANTFVQSDRTKLFENGRIHSLGSRYSLLSGSRSGWNRWKNCLRECVRVGR